MLSRSCHREDEVRQASAAGRWTTALRSHVNSCTSCGEVALVATTLATPVVGAPASLDPDLIWERARRARYLETEARISRVLTGAETAGSAVVLGVMAAFVRWPLSWPPIALDAGHGVLLWGATGLMLLAVLGVAGWAREI